MRPVVPLFVAWMMVCGTSGTVASPPSQWRPYTLPGVLAPEFEHRTDPEPVWVIRATRWGQYGAWQREYEVEPGRWYEFRIWRRVQGISSPRRSALVELWWQTAQGGRAARPAVVPQPDYPTPTSIRNGPWQLLQGRFQAPPAATKVVVRLVLRWCAQGTVWWKAPQLLPAQAPKPRKVRLAAVHFIPPGKSPLENVRSFFPLIEKAAQQKADLVCLGECITYIGTGKSYAEVAEPVPGPSTRLLGQVAKKHDLYIVVGLVEQDQGAIYNTAALIGPEGKLVGKYRKLCVPTGENTGGVVPGNDYPVFRTRFGTVGMMICWDVHFPEVARGLANRGAEVIAMPIWGGDPRLAQARAIENQIYLLTSTYNTRPNWMVSGIWGPGGQLLAQAHRWGSVVVVEVDLNRRFYHFGFGPFRDRILHERPTWMPTE